jgi:hypothetical protein
MAGSVGHGEDSARLPASKTLGEGLISNSSILQQIGALTPDVVALTRFRAKAIEQINIQKGSIECLKRQIPREGLSPCIEPAMSVEEQYWKN